MNIIAFSCVNLGGKKVTHSHTKRSCGRGGVTAVTSAKVLHIAISMASKNFMHEKVCIIMSMTSISRARTHNSNRTTKMLHVSSAYSDYEYIGMFSYHRVAWVFRVVSIIARSDGWIWTVVVVVVVVYCCAAGFFVGDTLKWFNSVKNDTRFKFFPNAQKPKSLHKSYIWRYRSYHLIHQTFLFAFDAESIDIREFHDKTKWANERWEWKRCW